MKTILNDEPTSMASIVEDSMSQQESKCYEHELEYNDDGFTGLCAKCGVPIKTDGTLDE